MYNTRVAVISAASLFFGITGYSQKQQEKLERAGGQFGQAVDNATDAALDAVEKAADKLESWTDQAVSNDKNAAETTAKRDKQQHSEVADEPR